MRNPLTLIGPDLTIYLGRLIPRLHYRNHSTITTEFFFLCLRSCRPPLLFRGCRRSLVASVACKSSHLPTFFVGEVFKRLAVISSSTCISFQFLRNPPSRCARERANGDKIFLPGPFPSQARSVSPLGWNLRRGSPLSTTPTERDSTLRFMPRNNPVFACSCLSVFFFPPFQSSLTP